MGIRCQAWPFSPTAPDDAPIVLVTPEGFVQPGFQDLLVRWRAQARLDRIVLDECHLTLDRNPTFCTAFSSLWTLGLMEVPLLFLTATLPPAREADFWRQLRLAFALPAPTVLRTATGRANIAYEVRQLPRGQTATDAVRNIVASSPSQGATIVFCRQVTIAVRLAQELNGLLYHADLEAKEDMLLRFLTSSNRTMVAITALSLGLDKPDISLVGHVDDPYDLVGYVQESGRVGRDGRACAALILRTQSQPPLMMDWPLREYLFGRAGRRVCRRTLLNGYLDGDSDHTSCQVDEARCDICRQTATQPWTGGSLSSPMIKMPPPSSTSAGADEEQAFQRRQTCVPVERTLSPFRSNCGCWKPCTTSACTAWWARTNIILSKIVPGKTALRTTRSNRLYKDEFDMINSLGAIFMGFHKAFVIVGNVRGLVTMYETKANLANTLDYS